jgi:hypothetical protein
MAQSQLRDQSRATLRRKPAGTVRRAVAITARHASGHINAMARRIGDTLPPGGRLIPTL